MSRDPSPPLPRRQFLHTLGLAGLSAAASPALAMAQSPQPKPAAKPDTTAAAAKPEGPSADARALAAMLGRRYARLTPTEVESIAKDIDGDLQAGKRLRDAKLANSDEPDMVFRPGDMPPGSE